MRIYIVVEVERDSMCRANCAVYLTEKEAEAYQLASETHPAWDKCSKGAKALHARNTFQILGSGLNNPSSFLICWAQVDKHGKIKGGTATAWNLAKANGVPCFNLYNEEDKQRLIKFVEGE